MNNKSLSDLLWEFDPNGLVATDKDMNIRLVNPAFCRMFEVDADEIIGQPASDLLGDVSDFREVWQRNSVIQAKEQDYPAYGLHLRKVIFSIPDEEIIACIMVDVTHEWQQVEDLRHFRQETIQKANEVVNNQMKVAQEIAGLLGEATAETKVTMLRLIQLVEQGPT